MFAFDFFCHCRERNEVVLLAVLGINDDIIIKNICALHALLAERKIYRRARADKQELVFLVIAYARKPAWPRRRLDVHPYLADGVRDIVAHPAYNYVEL